MGMLLQRNRERRTQEVEEVVSDIQPKEVTTSEVEAADEIVSDSQTKEVPTSEVEETDEKPKRKQRAKKA